MMSAVDEIKAWRRSLNWTQEQAATALGVPVQTVTRHRRVLTLALAQLTSEQSTKKARPTTQRRFSTP
jgi:transcriptional regulator with XRE-family HTH domain